MKTPHIFIGICLIFSVISKAQFLQAEDKEGIAAGQERLSELAKQCDQLDEKYEVAFYVQCLTKTAEQNGAEIALQEYLVRQIRDRVNSAYRADVSGLQEANSGMTFWKHSLNLKKQKLRASASARRYALKVKEYPQDAKAPPAIWGYTNMVTAPLSSYTLLQYPGLIDVLSLNMDMKVVEAKRIEGIFTLTLVPYEGRGGVVIEFKEDPSWIPVKVETYSSDGDPVAVGSADVAKNLRSSGILLARIVSRWHEQSPGTWVPSYVRSTNISRANTETDVEISFSDWKFGDEIESKSLTKESFGREALLAVNFEKLRESIKKNISQD